MFETQVTLIGNVLTVPQLRRLTSSGQVAASFRVASTSRRFDRDAQQWVDGQSLRLRVTCWRRLAESVVTSVETGDPVIVVGRLYTRDWTDDQGNHRVLYEMDATSIGHDLSRGTAKFKRTPAKLGTSAIEDEEAERRIAGEDTVPEELDPTSELHKAGFTAELIDEEVEGFDFSQQSEEAEGERVLVPA